MKLTAITRLYSDILNSSIFGVNRAKSTTIIEGQPAVGFGALPSEGKGHTFESCRVRQQNQAFI
jgi:hypothetical protein